MKNEKMSGCGLVAALMQQHTQLRVALINDPRLREREAAQAHEHFIEASRRAECAARRDAWRATTAPNWSNQQRMALQITPALRPSSSLSMVHRLRLKRKYERTTQLIIDAENENCETMIYSSSSMHAS
ncbi:hypothetical protein [Burkholderia sp. GbtcB21]|uniref:hypothetical protein n=1 Tax=Burkholderia sp. GbtcB21 TaxID=2824766 RepID=UPI001C2F5E5F|nr:hypothetical protein [Burkholderia sp. GbtcB21]